jgi:hypothetical protein
MHETTARLALRAGLLYLAVGALLVGLWAAFFPRSFNDDFPGIATWVAPHGPYNEHLVRDVGAFELGIAVLLLAAAWRLSRELILVAIVATVVSGVLHLVFHLRNSDPDGTGVDVTSIVSLALIPAVALALLIPLRSLDERDAGAGTT